jgi:hypothetical protein
MLLDKLREQLKYEPEVGIFRWCISRPNYIVDIAGLDER